MNNFSTTEDGWDTREHDDQKLTIETTNHPRYNFREGARDILDNHHHSLEPDMVFGWRPKLPSCPLPLTYTNPYTDALLAHLPNDDRFKLVFLGPRPANSVQINQQYDYPWRYRSRYNTSLTAVRDAIKRVGQGGRRLNFQPFPGQLQFDSSFQSGNLDMAVRVKRGQYDLFLRSDTNTRGHTSWYYFKVSNRDLVGQVQLNLCNFGKRRNLYASGLRPYERTEGMDWKQDKAYDVHWVERLCRYGFQRKSFQLQFKYNFKEKNQTIYFAYSIPYTYTRLQKMVAEVSQNRKIVEQTRLCQSLGGLQLPLLTIGNRSEEGENSDSSNNDDIRSKKHVLITGRIHPGQPHSSFIVEGMIKFLVSDHPLADILRRNFTFHIIPMLNPDGVVTGNFRTSFSGKDLNRQFNKLNKFIFPQITALHELALQLKRAHRSAFQFYFDFHAHSSKKGLFCYGPEHVAGKNEFFKCRALAKLIQQKTPIFSYFRSIFTVSQAKKATGRAHMLWKIKLPMSFTFQVSNGLYESKDSKCCPILQRDLTDMGKGIMQGFARYAALEMRIPSMKIRAKVDTGIKKRSGLSAKQFRKSTSKKSKTLTIKQMNRQLKESSNTQLLRDQKQTSLHDIICNDLQEKYQNCLEKQEFLRIIKQIKNQQAEDRQVNDYQGRSDSESEGDDLDDQQIVKLHKLIETRNQKTKSYSKGFLQWKSKNRNDVVRRQSQSQDIKQNFISVPQEVPKKPVTSKYLQSIKLAALPPRAKRIPQYQPDKVVLAARNFALDI